VETGFSFCPCPETLSHTRKKLYKLVIDKTNHPQERELALQNGFDPDDLCRISQLCKNPLGWKPLLATIPDILKRLRHTTQSVYIIGCIKNICEFGDGIDLQILAIHALVFCREFFAAIESQCNEMMLLTCIPYLFKRCAVFSRAIVKGYEAAIQREWVTETISVLREKDITCMIAEGLCEEYSEMIARDALLDMGQFCGISSFTSSSEWWSSWYNTPESIQTLESNKFSAFTIMNSIEVIEGKVLKKLELFSMRYGISFVHTHLDMHLWVHQHGCRRVIAHASDSVSSGCNNQKRILLVGIRNGFKKHVSISKGRIASQNSMATTLATTSATSAAAAAASASSTSSTNFANVMFYLDQANIFQQQHLLLPPHTEKKSYLADLHSELERFIDELCEYYL